MQTSYNDRFLTPSKISRQMKGKPIFRDKLYPED